MKFREYNAWTLWVWDDISVTAAGNGAPGFVDEGVCSGRLRRRGKDGS
jgi:hypothetical protein